MCLCKELICGNSTLQYLLYSVQLASADQHQVVSEVPLPVAVRHASDLYQGPKVTLVVGQGVVGRDDQGSKFTYWQVVKTGTWGYRGHKVKGHKGLGPRRSKSGPTGQIERINGHMVKSSKDYK